MYVLYLIEEEKENHMKGEIILKCSCQHPHITNIYMQRCEKT